MDVDPLNQRIAIADPARRMGPTTSSAIEQLREEILLMTNSASTTAVRSLRPRRKKTATGVGLSFIAVVTFAGAAAAAGGLVARTGVFGSGGEEGSGEMIRTDASDATAVVSELGGEIALPPGGTFEKTAAAMRANGGLATEEGVRNILSWTAACQWATYWLDGDAAQRAEAQAMLDRIPDWPALVARNPDGGVKRIWQAIADAARINDEARLRDAGYTANCTS